MRVAGGPALLMEERAAPPMIWVLVDPRAGTAAQALGIAERLQARLGLGFRPVALEWGKLAALPWLPPGLAGLTPRSRVGFIPPWPRLVISAGRRSVPVALWLQRRGAALVHAMRPGPSAARRFDLLVIGQHDHPPPAPNILPILGATHRMSPNRLAEARAAWAELAGMPGPRVALLLGGGLKGQPMPAEQAARMARQASALAANLAANLATDRAGTVDGGSVLASTSRRTGPAASDAAAALLAGRPHRLFRWDQQQGGAQNPFAGFLAWADAVVVSTDSVSMISEALATGVPVFLAENQAGPRHQALVQSLLAAGQAQLLPATGGLPPLTASTRAPLDESGRVVDEILRRGLGGLSG